MWLLHHAAAHDDALGRQGYGDVGNPVGQVLRLQVPGGMVLRQRVGGRTPPGLHRGPGCEPFEAVAVVWTRTIEGIGPAVVRDADVAHLGVARAVERAALDDRAASDAGADRDIHEASERAAVPPAVFPEGGRVDVGVERNRELQSLGDGAYDVAVPPPLLGRGGDGAIGGRSGAQIYRAEGADSHSRQGCLAVVADEKVVDPGQGLGWSGRGNACAVADAVRPGADRTVDFRAASLYRAEEHFEDTTCQVSSCDTRPASHNAASQSRSLGRQTWQSL